MACALGPKIDTRTTGIRPGEKLHEEMISKAEAATTIEMEDRYVILPSLQFTNHKKLRELYLSKKGKLVMDLFKYESDTNSDWLTHEQLLDLLNEG